jgi:hypothetical protein
MTERIMNITAIQSYLANMFHTDKVRVREVNRVITIEPIEVSIDCTAGLRGLLADYPEMSVDKFLERKHADKELDL